MFTIDWPEPFGLAMIEALACGTPVIARPCGSVPEIIRHGVSGFIAKSVDEIAAAVGKIGQLSREACRREFEHRFTAEIMVDGYERVYRRLIEAGQRGLFGKPKGTYLQAETTLAISKVSEPGS
jgi:glycosyltransferase involved in cell wall biosynthesis